MIEPWCVYPREAKYFVNLVPPWTLRFALFDMANGFVSSLNQFTSGYLILISGEEGFLYSAKTASEIRLGNCD
jgi:hypothetical protein